MRRYYLGGAILLGSISLRKGCSKALAQVMRFSGSRISILSIKSRATGGILQKTIINYSMLRVINVQSTDDSKVKSIHDSCYDCHYANKHLQCKFLFQSSSVLFLGFHGVEEWQADDIRPNRWCRGSTNLATMISDKRLASYLVNGSQR